MQIRNSTLEVRGDFKWTDIILILYNMEKYYGAL